MADNKNTRFQFTAFEGQYEVVDKAKLDVEFVKILLYQEEVAPTTGKKHRQGCLQTQLPVRIGRVKALLPGVHVEVARDWSALIKYCQKTETRDASGTSVHISNPTYVRKKVSDFLEDIAEHVLMEFDVSFDCDYSLISQPTHPSTQTVSEETMMKEYWSAVRYILRVNPDAIGILAQPLPQNAWKNTRSVWLERVIDRCPEWAPKKYTQERWSRR